MAAATHPEVFARSVAERLSRQGKKVPSAFTGPAYTFIPDDGELPSLYASEDVADPLCRIKLFDTAGAFTLYIIEGGISGTNGRFTLFGYIVGPLGDKELGYADLEELLDVRNALGLPLERDIYFEPTPLSKVREG